MTASTLGRVALAMLLALVGLRAHAQGQPSHPIKLLVGFSPGFNCERRGAAW